MSCRSTCDNCKYRLECKDKYKFSGNCRLKEENPRPELPKIKKPQEKYETVVFK